jgi:dolichyl-phosphate beta-glucosyltransferase
MSSESISVVVPCFNEEKAIRQNLNNVFKFLNSRFGFFELIAVNDGSQDQTLEELKKLQVSIPLIIINNKINGGKGKAVKDGVLASKNEVIMFLDADLAIPIEELEKFLPELKNGYDIAIASRFVPGVKILKPVLWYRQRMERVFRIMRLVVLNDRAIKDTQCGFKVFTRQAALRIFNITRINRFAFDAEIVFLAKKFDYKIKELPISLQNPKNSHIKIIRDSLNMAADLIRIRVNDFLKRYDYSARTNEAEADFGG